MIDISNLCFTYTENGIQGTVLDGINLSVKTGEFVSVIGPSGCGKTSLLRLIADLEKPASGSVSINGMTPRQAREKHTYGYVFQAASLLPWKSVAENVAVPLAIMGYSGTDSKQRIESALELVGLSASGSKYPWQLSGGMQQRASIARALAFDADILLMDEPFGALDEITRHNLNEQLRTIWKNTGKTIIFVTHSVSEAVFLSTRIVVMSKSPGRIIESISPNLPEKREPQIRENREFVQTAKRIRGILLKDHQQGLQSASASD